MSFFGQSPLAAFLPLKAGQNLADLPDVSAARTNLGVLSATDTMMNGVPIGTIIPFYGSTAPLGYLPCSGQTINSGTYPDLVTFLGGTTSATVPDLRGEFLRGWDNGRGVDPSRTNLSVQAPSYLFDTVGSIATNNRLAHQILNEETGLQFTRSLTQIQVASLSTVTSFTDTGRSVRPRNVAVLYCIKAYGALVNTTIANLGNALSELSSKTSLTQFGASLGGSGYQKLPSGLIIQWGSCTTDSTGYGVFTLPIAFPSSTMAANAILVGAAAYGVNLSTFTTTSVSFNAWSGSGGVAGMNLNCFAIGY